MGEFKATTIGYSLGLREEDLSETLTSEVGVKESQMKNEKNEIRNRLDAMDRLEEAEERMTKRTKYWKEIKVIKRTIMQHKSRLREPSDSIKYNSIHMRSPRRREERGQENFFEEIMAENFPNPEKETDIQIQEAQRTPINKSRLTSRHVLMKFAAYSD